MGEGAGPAGPGHCTDQEVTSSSNTSTSSQCRLPHGAALQQRTLCLLLPELSSLTSLSTTPPSLNSQSVSQCCYPEEGQWARQHPLGYPEMPFISPHVQNSPTRRRGCLCVWQWVEEADNVWPKLGILESVDVNPLHPQKMKGCHFSLGDLRGASPTGRAGLLAYSPCQKGPHGGPDPQKQGPSLYSSIDLYLWSQDPAKYGQLSSSDRLSETNYPGLCPHGHWHPSEQSTVAPRV